MPMSSDNLLLAERKAVCKPATIDITMRREETNAGTTQMTALVKDSRAKRSRAKPFNDWVGCPSKSLQLRPKFHSLFLQNSFDFQKSAIFKGLKSSPRMY